MIHELVSRDREHDRATRVTIADCRFTEKLERSGKPAAKSELLNPTIINSN